MLWDSQSKSNTIQNPLKGYIDICLHMMISSTCVTCLLNYGCSPSLPTPLSSTSHYTNSRMCVCVCGLSLWQTLSHFHSPKMRSHHPSLCVRVCSVVCSNERLTCASVCVCVRVRVFRLVPMLVSVFRLIAAQWRHIPCIHIRGVQSRSLFLSVVIDLCVCVRAERQINFGCGIKLSHPTFFLFLGHLVSLWPCKEGNTVKRGISGFGANSELLREGNASNLSAKSDEWSRRNLRRAAGCHKHKLFMPVCQHCAVRNSVRGVVAPTNHCAQLIHILDLWPCKEGNTVEWGISGFGANSDRWREGNAFNLKCTEWRMVSPEFTAQFHLNTRTNSLHFRGAW